MSERLFSRYLIVIFILKGNIKLKFENVDKNYFDAVISQLRPIYRGPVLDWGEHGARMIPYTEKEKRKLSEKTRKLLLRDNVETETIEQQLDTFDMTFFYTKGNGDCLFEAILEAIVHPHKYVTRDLRKQVSLFMALYPEIFYEYVNQLCILKDMERANPNAPKQSYESFVTNLFHGKIWGDQVIASAIAKMWNIAITFIFPHGPELKLFHEKNIPDIVIVCNGSHDNPEEISHFSGASMYSNFKFKFQIILFNMKK